MSDEVPTNLINVEDDTPEPPVAVVEPDPAPAPVEEHPAEVDAVEVGGQKYVPVSVLRAIREDAKALKERAGRVDALEAEVAQTRPYMQFLQQNPDLLKRPAPVPQAAPAATVDPKLESLAKSLDLYTADGTLDLVRATTIKSLIDDSAQQVAQATVQPWQEQNAQAASTRNYHAMLNTSAPNGVKPDRNAFNALWSQLPASLTADASVAAMLQLMATGATVMQTKAQPAPPAAPPLVTESPGGNVSKRTALSALEQGVARQRGISDAKMQELSVGFKPGRTNVLEED